VCEGTNNKAELAAVSLGLRVVKKFFGTAGGGTMCIRPDSTYAQGVLSGTLRASANQALVRQVKKELAAWEKASWTIVWEKVAAHAGVPQNDAADRLAKRGAEIAEEFALTSPRTPQFFEVSPRDAAQSAQRDAAQSAQRDAAQSAQRDAAQSAQRDAAQSAQRDATQPAQRDAAQSAQRDAAQPARRDVQPVQDVQQSSDAGQPVRDAEPVQSAVQPVQSAAQPRSDTQPVQSAAAQPVQSDVTQPAERDAAQPMSEDEEAPVMMELDEPRARSEPPGVRALQLHAHKGTVNPQIPKPRPLRAPPGKIRCPVRTAVQH